MEAEKVAEGYNLKRLEKMAQNRLRSQMEANKVLTYALQWPCIAAKRAAVTRCFRAKPDIFFSFT